MQSWHQRAAARRSYELRNVKAHIRGNNWIATGQALCGKTNFQVHVETKHAHNPANNVCPKCVAKLNE